MKVVNRIKANKLFGETIKNGQTVKNQNYVIHYLKNDVQHIRVGLSVSNKLGNAVIRNRIKRQLRVMCDSVINYNNHSYDVVIIVKKPFLDNDFSKNSDSLHQLIETTGITK